jgi:hypothetical protein
MHHVVTINPFIITVQFRNPGLVSLDLLNIQRESVNMLCSVRTIVFIEFFKRLHARFASHLAIQRVFERFNTPTSRSCNMMSVTSQTENQMLTRKRW